MPDRNPTLRTFRNSGNNGIPVLILLLLLLIMTALVGCISQPSKPSGKAPEAGSGPSHEDYLDTQDLSFPYGHRRGPKDEGVTTKFLQFPVFENASYIKIVCDGDPGAIPRWDSGDRKDVDLYLYGIQADREVGSSATPEIHEEIILDDAKTISKGGVGNWKLEVDCYSGSNVDVTITIEVRYPENENASATEYSHPAAISQQSGEWLI